MYIDMICVKEKEKRKRKKKKKKIDPRLVRGFIEE